MINIIEVASPAPVATPVAPAADHTDAAPEDLSAAVPPPPSRARNTEDQPLPLRQNNSINIFEAELLSAAGGASAPSVACSQRDGAHIVAALNFNAKRVPFSPFDEAADGKLGSVYTRLTETLLARGDWDRRPALRNKATGEMKLPSSYSLLLGTAQGKGVPWGRLGYGVWPPPLVNYQRGFDMLTRKGKMAATIETAREEFGAEWPAGMPTALTAGACVRNPTDVWELAPPSFTFHPSKGEANPRAELREAYAARAALAGDAHPEKNRWILKPSEGAKGEGIFIESGLEKIEEHLDAQEARAAEGEAVSSWVVQQYIHNPLLLQDGQRKFDMRCWVLVDASYGIHLYRHGVLRVASASYDPSNVSDRFSHLTNHCIATEHAEYGKYEPTNEKFYPAFDAELAERYPELARAAAGVALFGDANDAEQRANGDDGRAAERAAELAVEGVTEGGTGSVMETVVLPQIRRQVVQTLLAAKERLATDGEYYRPFQLYGYDFLLDDELRVWLCEINASPAVADELLPGLVDALIRTTLDPICPPNADLLAKGKEAYDQAAAPSGSGERFECICPGKPEADEA